MILEPLRSSLRYGCNGPCFVGFRGRLTLQTPRNVEGCRENGLSGTQQGVPCLFRSSAMGWPSSCVCRARPWPTHMAELPCWGARGSARRRRFALLSVFPWFSGLFSKHRSRMNVILELLRIYLRHRHSCSCCTFSTLFRSPNTSKRRRMSRKRAVGDPTGGPLPFQELGHGMAELLRLQGSAMADPHGRAPLLGGSGVGQAASVRSFERVSLVFGAFLEAPKSYERDSRTVANISSTPTQLFLLYLLDALPLSKHLETSKDVEKTGCRGPNRGSPAFSGARPWDGRAPASAGLGHGRPTWPSSPAGGLGGRPGGVGSLF